MGCNTCHKNRIQHFKPRRKEMMQSKPEKCDICGAENWTVNYCAFCKHWLCQECRDNPVKRFKAASKEWKEKLVNKLKQS